MSKFNTGDKVKTDYGTFTVDAVSPKGVNGTLDKSGVQVFVPTAMFSNPHYSYSKA